MNIFDIVIAALLLYGFVNGIIKGLFVEIASLVALVAGVYGAIHFSYFIGGYLKEYVSWSEEYIAIAAFAATFVLIIVAITLLGKLLTKLLDVAALGILNKILGGVFGTLKFALILSVVFLFFDKLNNTLPMVDKQTLKDAVLFEPVKKVAPTIFPSILKDVAAN